MSALIIAVESERIYQIKLLLSNPSWNINHTDSSGQTALFKACLMKNKWKSIIVLKLLIEAGININVEDCLKRTCLSYACISGKEYLVKILLEIGDMAPNTQDVHSFTNLMYAVQSANHSVVAMLLLFLSKYSLSLDTRTKDGFTAYMIALKLGHFSIADLLQDNGASTETFDFKTHRKSDEWRKLSTEKMKRIHSRASTASAVTISQERTEKSNRRLHRYTSPFALEENTKKAPGECYHDSNIKSAGFSEVANLFNPCQRKLNDTEPSDDKLPNLTNIGNNTKSSEKSIYTTRRPPLNSTANFRQTTDANMLQYSTKRILGTLLNESVLTRTQIHEDNIRQERIANFNRNQQNKRLLSSSGELSTPPLQASLPTRKDVVENSHCNNDRMDIRRCRSSDPSRMRIRSTNLMKSVCLRRTSTTH